MTEITFDVTAFRVEFTEFANPTDFPDTLLQGKFNLATCYVNPNPNNYIAVGCLTQVLYLMTAHLTKLNSLINAGQTPGQVQSTTIDKITVTLTPPPLPNQWQWWLGLTAYGQQLLALLQSLAAGGFYFGSLPERSSIRSVGGVFPW